MATNLSLACSLGTPTLSETGTPRLLYLLLEIGGGQGSEALPVNKLRQADNSLEQGQLISSEAKKTIKLDSGGQPLRGRCLIAR